MVLPSMKTFAAPTPTAPQRSNHDIAQDFLDLSFLMESGRPLPRMTRFTGPIRVRLTGAPPANAHADLDVLLARLRREAQIDIQKLDAQPSPTPENANARPPAEITVDFVARRTMQAAVPNAACFVVPNVSSWEDFRRKRAESSLDWQTLPQRQFLAVFIPYDTSPQEVRDCLHEEIAQAIGPLNDLYRLNDSVFNDDNFHAVLTGQDMLILRAYYAPELQNGMTRDQVATRLPTLLARLNPAGENPKLPRRAAPPQPTPREWITAMEQALGARGGYIGRLAAARRALSVATRAGWQDGRMAFSLYAIGRLTQANDPETANRAFLAAGLLYATLPDARLQRAHVDLRLAAFALASDRPQQALALLERAEPVMQRAENAAMLATVLMLKSEALRTLNRADAAAQARLDSLGWARYGFADDAEVRQRMQRLDLPSP